MTKAVVALEKAEHMSGRVEQFGDCTLYLGDCREILPTFDTPLWRVGFGRIDAVVTDPPYGIGYVNGPISPRSISTTRKRSQASIVGDKTPFDPLQFLECASACCFTGAQHFAQRLPGGTFHVWNKRVGYTPLDQGDGDLLWISGEKRALRIVDLLWRGLCRSTEVSAPIEHPMQKPIALMDWCLKQLPDARTILDPFMGSGTTGVACVKLGRKFIGVEIEERYFSIACRRIEDAVSRPDLFAAEKQPEPAEQISLLDEAAA